MKISTYNKRRKRLNEYKTLLLMYINNANKLIKSNDPILITAPNFKMYSKYLQYLWKSKKYKQFYHLIYRKDL